MTYHLSDIYQDYKENGGKLDWETFSSLCNEFNQLVMDEIILQGNDFNQGQYLSIIGVRKRERNYNNRQVNWKASYELRDQLINEGKQLYDSKTGEGHKWLVYYTDPWYCQFYWNKYGSSVPNRSKYQFTATRGRVGNKTKLKKILDKPGGHVRFTKEN